MDGERVPTSYKSTSVGLDPRAFNSYGEGNSEYWLYKFKNSENKKLTMQTDENSIGAEFTNNSGNRFGGLYGYHEKMFYCSNDYIVLRTVDEIDFNRCHYRCPTNEFGERIKFPPTFLRREVWIKAEPLTMKKNYKF